MGKVSFVVCVVILLLIPSQSITLLHPRSSGNWSWNAPPFDTACVRITVNQGQRLESRFTSQIEPIDFYLYKAQDLDSLDDYLSLPAIEHFFGKTYRCDFVSQSDTDWLVIFVNNNNITQEVEYEYTVYDIPVQTFLRDLPTIITVLLPIVCVVVVSVAVLRRRT